jgi:superfamily II DNA helicase RecQ
MEEMAVVVCLRCQAQLQKEGLKGVVYCWSKKQCEKLAEALDCLYYHVDVLDRADRLAVWEQDGGLIVATAALGTGVDYLGIVYIVHVGMLWSMIDFAQESGRGGRAGEVVDLVILVEHGEVERRLLQEVDKIDVQAMGLFIVGSGCRRLLMSWYMDRAGVSCGDLEQSAGCDWCGDGVRQWLDEQESSSWEW